MTNVHCPRQSCDFWQDGWCQSDEIELDPVTLSCQTFFESGDDVEEPEILDEEALDDLEWDDDESLIDDELDERHYDPYRLDLGRLEDDLEDDEPDIEDEYELIDEDSDGW